MDSTSLLHLLQGPFNFLRPDMEEVRRLVPELQRALPTPRPIYLEDETATPIHGFPILQSQGMDGLRKALGQFLLAEETAQVAAARRDTFDRKAYAMAWERYVALLAKAVENATISSYGRQYPAVFWLHHSLEIARVLKDTPRRILRIDSDLGRRQGDAIKYRILDRYLDRVLSTTYEIVQKVAGATEEVEEELFPRLLTRMRDNVLVFTEDYIGRDLGELGSYFNGSLRIDPRDFRQRLDDLGRWHAAQLESDRELRSAVTNLLRHDPKSDPRDLLIRPGYVSYLSNLKAYNAAKLLPPHLVQVWESLLVKLKEFELFHSFRKSLVPVEPTETGFIARETPGARTGASPVRLSHATRPLDFLEPWVVDPRVERFGMIYDISDFSQTLSVLHRAGTESQDDAFRKMFRFQRRINRLALAHRVKLEKYLGDGAFYSCREALRLLICSVQIQQLYDEALREGFPFDRGMRVALNYGAYRLIPMGSGRPGETERYEFFGPGLVELSRLTTGKGTQEIEEVKTMLINQGFSATQVHSFFAPLAGKNLDVVDKKEESRRFYAYLNRNGTLHNNGMVATAPYIQRLEKEIGERKLLRASDGERVYVLLEVEDGGSSVWVGMRKLGMAQLKGLEKLAVYEVVQGSTLDPGSYQEIRGESLGAAIEKEFTSGALSRR
ncbi:MAG TPA: hypothetical protein VH394_30875 [Thermoanaerobaculia bacterium]|jgi:hypothetical protein|nr:hypothetical protein [Thermoanaerobaculia bacterium]